MTFNTNTAIGLAGVVVAAVLAVWLGIHIFTVLITFLVLAAIVYFVPALNTAVFGFLGWTEPTPSELYAEIEADVAAVVAKCEAAATGLYDEVTGHTADAVVSTKLAESKAKLAARAQATADNHRALIAT